jgi:hypothetical protein
MDAGGAGGGAGAGGAGDDARRGGAQASQASNMDLSTSGSASGSASGGEAADKAEKAVAEPEPESAEGKGYVARAAAINRPEAHWALLGLFGAMLNGALFPARPPPHTHPAPLRLPFASCVWRRCMLQEPACA